MRRPWERSFHAVFFGGAAGKTQRGGRYLPWRGGRGCVGAFFRTRRAGGGTAFLRTRWAGGGTAFLRHSLRWKHGQRAYLCFRALSPASCGKGEPVSAEDAAGGVASARCAGTGRGRGGEVFSIRFAGGRCPACDAEGAPHTFAARRFCLCASRGDCRQAMSGDGAGSAEEVAAGGGVGVPCG